jgi:hypothetical protein
VIPAEGSQSSHRILLMRKAPALSLIETLVGGPYVSIEGFSTVMHEGDSVNCYAFRARKVTDTRPNAFANLLWLQSLLRRYPDGWEDQVPYTLQGPIVLLYGDREFMGALFESLLLTESEKITPPLLERTS